MLLVTMGSQKIQCDRIINTIINAKIKEKIIVQAFYTPDKNYPNIDFVGFVSYDEMEKLIDKSDIVVVSGTGGILRALNKNKKVIIFPRLGRYKEAADDHGLDMKVLATYGYASFVEDAKDFKKVYNECKKKTYKKFESNKEKFLSLFKEELKKHNF